MTPERRAPRLRVPTALLWTAVLVVATGSLLLIRARLDKTHVALVFLLVVLFGAAAGGRLLGLWLAGVSFLAFNWFFLPPYNTFVIRDPLDWFVLVAFLLTSVVSAHLLSRAQEEALAASDRAEEVDRLASVGAEALNVVRAEDALRSISDVIRATTGVDQCAIYARAEDGSPRLLGASPLAEFEAAASAGSASLVEWVATTGSAALEQRDGTTRLTSARPAIESLAALEAANTLAVVLPLRVRERTVGVLRIANRGGVKLDPERWRFVDAISYYAALGVERVRLAAEAEHVEALREADRLKDALLASVSHDLRTPLTTIKALAHDLAEFGDERTEIIEQEADRLNRMVEDLLDLSKLKAGALQVRLELNAVDDLIGALVQQVEPSLRGRRLAVTLPPGEPVLVGRFDFVHALRALGNLVMNAAQHAPGAEPIEVDVMVEGQEIAITVMDRGPGVPESDVDRIFDPFFRPAGAPSDGKNAGLGLSIARSLAEAQGGRLTYAPRAGGGAAFTLHLPAASLDSDMTTATPGRAADERGQRPQTNADNGPRSL